MVFIVLFLILLFIEIKYKPRLDWVISRNKYIVLLWYYKTVDTRGWIKIFEV